MMAREDFGALLTEHERIVFKVASVYARTVDDRRDLAQEIATQLWRAFPRFDPARGKFSTWMYRIALNVAISSLRRARHHEPLADDHPALPPPDDHVRELYGFIAELAPLDRALILLYLDDHTHAEIADVLGISETNVATKIGRLKTQLRHRARGA